MIRIRMMVRGDLLCPIMGFLSENPWSNRVIENCCSAVDLDLHVKYATGSLRDVPQWYSSTAVPRYPDTSYLIYVLSTQVLPYPDTSYLMY